MKKLLLATFAILMGFTTTSRAAFDEEATYQTLFRMLSTGSPDGAYGSTEISGYDNGTTDFVRQLWNINELPSDEAICVWNDYGIPDLCNGDYKIDNPQASGLFQRLHFGIFKANLYLENAPATLTLRRAEARFLRAMFYLYALDLFGNFPFSTETEKNLFVHYTDYANAAGIEISAATEEEYEQYLALVKTYENNTIDRPKQIGKKALYNFIESELLAAETELPNPGSEIYYRPSKAAAWLLLARLYLNAEVYTGTSQWEKARSYARQITGIKAYQLSTDYVRLFMGDNDKNGAEKEMILPVYVDNEKMNSWGNTLFLIASCFNYDMPPNGINQKWGGNYARETLVNKFDEGDVRKMFQSISSGYGTTKWTNIYSDGTDPYTSFADTDFPLLRQAEAYLTLAEADARLNGGTCTSEGIDALNALRNRAHASTLSRASLQDICDEWAREFYFEGRRRSDMIRFSTYEHNMLYPITNVIMAMSEDYEQTPGYTDVNKVKIDPTFVLDTPPYASQTIDMNDYSGMMFTWTPPAISGWEDPVTYYLDVSPTGKFLNYDDEGYDWNDAIGGWVSSTWMTLAYDEDIVSLPIFTEDNIINSSLYSSKWYENNPMTLYVRCRAVVGIKESVSNVVKITLVPTTNAPQTFVDAKVKVSPIGTINLKGIDDDNLVAVCKLASLPAGTIAGRARIGVDGQKCDLTLNGDTYYGRAGDLKQIMMKTDLSAIVEIECWNDGLAQWKQSTSAISLTVVPDLHSYYLVGSWNNWDPANRDYPLHTTDNKIFTIEIAGPESDGDGWFKIAPEDAAINSWDASGWIQVETNGESSFEGTFIVGPSYFGAWHLPVLGEGYDRYRLTFDLTNYRYHFEPLATTGIELVHNSESVVHSSSSNIHHPSHVYDLQGRLVREPQTPGIYVIGGKKIVVR